MWIESETILSYNISTCNNSKNKQKFSLRGLQDHRAHTSISLDISRFRHVSIYKSENKKYTQQLEKAIFLYDSTTV